VSDPTSLTISIDRTSMSLPALLLTGHDDPARLMSVASYREPSMQPRITYAPTGDAHGDMPLGWSYQETVIAFNVFCERPATEADARSAIAEVAAALGRLNYTMTITVNGAAPETWTCRPGSIQAADDRTSTDMGTHENVWGVAIPAYPIRSV
jgi:hypothetical protein